MADKQDRSLLTEQRARPTILVVASDVKMLKLLGMALATEYACDVLSLSGGRGAAETAERVKPDLVIIDAHLHDGNAWDLADQLHRTTGLASVPTLLINIPEASWRTPQRDHTVMLREPFVLLDFYAAVNRSLDRR